MSETTPTGIEIHNRFCGEDGHICQYCMLSLERRLDGIGTSHPTVPAPAATDAPPEQYRGRWSYDYDEKSQRFHICTGGYCVAETEDSEVADLICKLKNQQPTSPAQAAEGRVLTAADIEKLTEGNHTCGRNCTCTCGRSYNAKWEPFLSRRGRFAPDCKCLALPEWKAKSVPKGAPPQSPPAVTEDGIERAAREWFREQGYFETTEETLAAFARTQVDAERNRVREEDCRAVCWPLAPERPHPHDKGVHSQACDAIRKLGGSL